MLATEATRPTVEDRMRILAIDPGIKHTGWCLVQVGGPLVIGGSSQQFDVLASGTIIRKNGVSASASINQQVKFFTDLLVQHPEVSKIWIEDYVLYRPSKGAGNALKLIGALVAMPTCLSTRITELETSLVNAVTWKTWLRKTHAADALTKAGEYATVATQHEADAICLALFAANYYYEQGEFDA